jgi:hypothetical protein
VRTLTAAIITVGLVASLSACAPASYSDESGSCEPINRPGEASALIEASGEPGTVLTPRFPTPLITDGIEVSTVSAGDGDTVYPGEVADFHVTFADATTAEVIGLQGLDAASIVRRTAGDGTPLGDVLACAAVGDRLGITAEAGEIGLATDPDDTTTVVLIIDVVRSYLGRADGVAQLAVNGMPAIALAPSGQPGVTIPNAEAPTKTRSATTLLGSGQKVEEGDAVVLHQMIVAWDSKTALESSTWAVGERPAIPTTVLATEDITGSRSGVIPALADALIGAKVGSQLLVVVPPGDDSFGEGATLPTGATATDTLVYVVDVLGIQED